MRKVHPHLLTSFLRKGAQKTLNYRNDPFVTLKKAGYSYTSLRLVTASTARCSDLWPRLVCSLLQTWEAQQSINVGRRLKPSILAAGRKHGAKWVELVYSTSGLLMSAHAYRP